MFGSLFTRDQEYMRYHQELLDRLDRIEKTIRLLAAAAQGRRTGIWRQPWTDEDMADVERRAREAGL